MTASEKALLFGAVAVAVVVVVAALGAGTSSPPSMFTLGHQGLPPIPIDATGIGSAVSSPLVPRHDTTVTVGWNDKALPSNWGAPQPV